MIYRAHRPFKIRVILTLASAVLLSFLGRSEAIILFRTGDPAANTTEPTGPLAGSGWQYEGQFGNFLGTAIAPHFLITAHHVGGSAQFIFHGVSYPIIRTITDAASDLAIHEVSGTLPTYAPLYASRDEVGRQFVVIGRGTRRGTGRTVNAQLRGWEWGSSDMVQRWGQNQVASLTSGGNVLYALFDQAGLPQEAHLSGGDSGGGLFINDGGSWKLAGVNLDVDRFASGPDGGGPYNAAMFDMRGSYRPNGTLVTGSAPVPSGFYATRISSRAAWISSVIGVPPPSAPPVGSHVQNDFNLDFKPDLLWQNGRTGERVIWFMNGSTKMSEEYLPTVSTTWQIATTGDFNGDGHTDIVWQNSTTGQRVIWLMNETHLIEERSLPSVGVGWQIAATGDFNGDHQADLLWQHLTTGQRDIWFMNGTTWIGEHFLPNVSTAWRIVGTDDFSADGQIDVVWENTVTGQRTIWLMNGATKIGERALPTTPTQWQIAGTGDFNGDGQADLVWQNTTTGQRDLWFMNGASKVGERYLPTIPTEWEIRNH
jgi:hypothetical protein